MGQFALRSFSVKALHYKKFSVQITFAVMSSVRKKYSLVDKTAVMFFAGRSAVPNSNSSVKTIIFAEV